jgi:hypothetical protein
VLVRVLRSENFDIATTLAAFLFGVVIPVILIPFPEALGEPLVPRWILLVRCTGARVPAPFCCHERLAPCYWERAKPCLNDGTLGASQDEDRISIVVVGVVAKEMEEMVIVTRDAI